MQYTLAGSLPCQTALHALKVSRQAHVKSICCRAATPSAAGPLIEPYKVSIVQLGCPKNTTDAEVLLGDLVKSGFEVTEELEESDAVIVNTCAFVEAAKAESLEVLPRHVHAPRRRRTHVACLMGLQQVCMLGANTSCMLATGHPGGGSTEGRWDSQESGCHRLPGTALLAGACWWALRS